MILIDELKNEINSIFNHPFVQEKDKLRKVAVQQYVFIQITKKAVTQ
jgi:thiaminase